MRLAWDPGGEATALRVYEFTDQDVEYRHAWVVNVRQMRRRLTESLEEYNAQFVNRMCEQHVHHSHCVPQGHTGCCCTPTGHHHPHVASWRSFVTPEQQRTRLESYLKDLKAEAEAVQARIAELEGSE